jgi:hypothetical protein
MPQGCSKDKKVKKMQYLGIKISLEKEDKDKGLLLMHCIIIPYFIVNALTQKYNDLPMTHAVTL